MKVTLERSGKGISLTVPWSDPDSDHARWYPDGRCGMDIPPRPDPLPLPLPKRVLFLDSHGPVLLIRCRARGFHSTMFGPGSETLWSRAAIIGVREDLEFDRPHGLQTEISGLRAWLGATSWNEERNISGAHLTALLSSEDAPSIEIGEHDGISLAFPPGWQLLHEDGGDRRVLLDVVRSTTRSVQALGWDKHRQVHQAIRDLLVLLRWRSESCVEVYALREDDCVRTEDGKEHGAYWRDVVVPNDERTSQPSGYHPHLIRYQELLEPGVLRWLELRNKFARALDPVISSIDLHGTTANTMLAHTGPGLEALGYLLLTRDGTAEKVAAKATLRTRLGVPGQGVGSGESG